MGDLIARLRTEGPNVWRQLSMAQRASLIAVALSAVVAIYFLTNWAQQTEYSVVFTKLPESDAAAVVAKLKELKIPYELADGGSTVKVPSNQAYEVRLQMASQGLPKGGAIGYELFDKTSFGLTDFAQKLNFQRALEGELARTIATLSGVEEARVHIVLPQSELFQDREKPTTASVVLKLKGGGTLDARQVRGVVNLVSRSVEGLKPENVTVLDGNGVTLSGQDDNSLMAVGGTSTQRDAQHGYEQSVQRDIQAMLEQVLGPRKAVVRVSAVLDWDRFESTSETYSPNGKPAQVRSSREQSELSATPLGDGSSGTPTYPLDGRTPAGPVSPDATPAPTATPSTATAAAATPSPVATVQSSTSVLDPKYSRRDVTTNYELSKVVEKTVKSPGGLKRLSVSVLLDGQLDEAMTSTISKAVTAAAGLDSTRGDTVVVASLPFDQSAATAQDKADADVAQRDMYVGIAKGAMVAVSLLVVLLLVRSVIVGLTRDPNAPSKKKGKKEKAALKAQEALPALPAMAVPEEDPRPALVQREITKLAHSEPKLLAQIVKSWLDEKQ